RHPSTFGFFRHPPTSVNSQSLRSFPPQSDLTERVPDPVGGGAVEPPRRWSSTSCHGRRRHLLPHDPLPRLRPQAPLPHATRTLSRHASLPRRLSRADEPEQRWPTPSPPPSLWTRRRRRRRRRRRPRTRRTRCWTARSLISRVSLHMCSSSMDQCLISPR
uniref:Uncharacterized protein n=1 Tax=Aegilops tauschii subsp. strangulata TaxID=200361 RepID=A0A453R5S3_AEGTS